MHKQRTGIDQIKNGAIHPKCSIYIILFTIFSFKLDLLNLPEENFATVIAQHYKNHCLFPLNTPAGEDTYD